ncbi:unnamed protein product [Eruca vesicaria subsp. sativa]|uniref:SPT2 chromatin protein n=1 Tax=Eruca vesicaria subsp. sativa TaxID=29727 RepID=A0ABC8JWP6_ERUVS|nr:unnamed protein product [Eruca vesicaria subsp. sativa]
MSSYLAELRHRSEAEFLEFRQRIKDSIRQKTQNVNDIAPTSSDSNPRKRKLHEFGSFFGPSQPGIASRVLQESKPLLKDELLATKVLGPIQTVSLHHIYYIATLKRKAKKLKESRDYSFLLSDDAELPVPIMEPPYSLKAPVPNSRPSSRGGQSRPDSSGIRVCSRPDSSIKGQPQTKPCSAKLAPARKSEPVDNKKKLTQKPHSSSKSLTSDLNQQRVEQRKVSSENKMSSQMVPRQQALSSLKHHTMVSKPPLKQAHQLKKKKKVSEEDEEALRMVREMCKTDRFAGRDLDYDDRGMEASIEDIIKEEKRSEKLAKKEDLEQLRLIEEEERRERVLRKEKRRKLSH